MLRNLFINLYFKKIKHKQISSPFRIASSNPTIPKNHRYKAEDKIWNSRSKFEIPFEEKRKIMGPVFRNSTQQLIHGGGIARNQIYADASLSSSSPPSPRPTFIHLPRWKLCEAGSAGRRDNGGSPLRWRLKEILPKRRKKKKKNRRGWNVTNDTDRTKRKWALFQRSLLFRKMNNSFVVWEKQRRETSLIDSSNLDYYRSRIPGITISLILFLFLFFLYNPKESRKRIPYLVYRRDTIEFAQPCRICRD